MTDRRRKIEALRAKADSTTFPAEAAALRAKADELAAQEPKPYTPPSAERTGFDAVDDFIAQQEPLFWQPRPYGTPTVRYENVRVHGNFFEEMGGILFTPPPWATVTANNRVRVTDVNGHTYWITVE